MLVLCDDSDSRKVRESLPAACVGDDKVIFVQDSCLWHELWYQVQTIPGAREGGLAIPIHSIQKQELRGDEVNEGDVDSRGVLHIRGASRTFICQQTDYMRACWASRSVRICACKGSAAHALAAPIGVIDAEATTGSRSCICCYCQIPYV